VDETVTRVASSTFRIKSWAQSPFVAPTRIFHGTTESESVARRRTVTEKERLELIAAKNIRKQLRATRECKRFQIPHLLFSSFDCNAIDNAGIVTRMLNAINSSRLDITEGSREFPQHSGFM